MTYSCSSDYASAMELRQLEAFVAVATELHFGRAAERLSIGQPTLSDMVQRLEREFGTALLTRTTRRVALTPAGEELLARAKVLLDEAAATKAAVRRIAAGESGAVRVAITPPVAATLAPHLRAAARSVLPDVVVTVQRMWLPDLTRSLADGSIDVALTCGRMPEATGVVNAVFCSESLLVGLRPDHPLAGSDGVALSDLGEHPLGLPGQSLFPNWALAQRQALDEAGLVASGGGARRDRPVVVGLDQSARGDLGAPHGVARPTAGHHGPARHSGPAHALHLAVESRAGADRRGGSLREARPHYQCAAGVAHRGGPPSLQPLTPRH